MRATAVEIGLRQRFGLAGTSLAPGIDQDDLKRRIGRSHAQEVRVDEAHGKHGHVQADGHRQCHDEHLVGQEGRKAAR